jgi:hypothetical protein
MRVMPLWGLAQRVIESLSSAIEATILAWAGWMGGRSLGYNLVRRQSWSWGPESYPGSREDEATGVVMLDDAVGVGTSEGGRAEEGGRRVSSDPRSVRSGVGNAGTQDAVVQTTS